ETHLGWAGRGLGEQIQKHLAENWSPAKVRDRLKAIAAKPGAKKALDEMSDDDIMDLARRHGRGIHVATPVFDGPSEAEIKAGLGGGGLPPAGQAVLFDGRRGEPFQGDVTVGIMYMIKLAPLVDDKIPAPPIGPFSLVAQQPLGGKAQFGGQRLG